MQKIYTFKIRNYNLKFLGTIVLSDMCFSIALHVYSREFTAFTCSNY